ncbi:MAG: energy-coupled thiamine transporter ThiT [Limnochordia bacterium]
MARERTRLLVEIAVMAGLAVVLNFFRVFRMPQGGSVSLEMIPIFYLAMRRGGVVGMIGGGIYGMVQLLTDPYIVHPAQFILDYPLAYLLVGLAGFFAARPALGVAIGCLGRYLAHVVSGAIFFGMYTPDGWNIWGYSAVYNLTYMIPEGIIAFLVLRLLLGRSQGRGKLFG